MASSRNLSNRIFLNLSVFEEDVNYFRSFAVFRARSFRGDELFYKRRILALEGIVARVGKTGFSGRGRVSHVQPVSSVR